MVQGVGGSGTVAIVVARWNELVTEALLAGATAEIEAQDFEPLVVRAPGAWEIPLLAQGVIERRKPRAVVALGCILQGETPHAALLARDVAGALMDLQMKTRVPIGWGILTPETAEQALDRAGMKHGNKGREAALAALAAAEELERL